MIESRAEVDVSPRENDVTRLCAGRGAGAGRKAVKTKSKRLAFCSAHAAEHAKDDRKGGGWLDREPLCPDCEWNAGYDEGFADARHMLCSHCIKCGRAADN